MRSNMYLRHFSPARSKAIPDWVRRFVRFHQMSHPRDLGAREVAGYLTWLVEHEQVAPSTQNQALAALLFLYRHVLNRPLEALGSIPRPRAPLRLSIVLTPNEGRRVLDRQAARPRAELQDGDGRVTLPGALARKYPNVGRSWQWQWAFPATSAIGIATPEP